jgi:cytochrome P450
MCGRYVQSARYVQKREKASKRAMSTIELRDYRSCDKALREPDLKQALYDEGALLMDRVLVTLHGEEHRERRLLEMRVFRRDFFRHYEYEVIPRIFESVVTPFLRRGSADVVDFGYRVMVYLAITFAGIDRQDDSEEEFDALVRLLRNFGLAATLGQAKGDRESAKAEIRAALEEFDQRFFTPSAARRQALIERFRAGDVSEAQLPMDILTVLLRNDDQLDLARDMVLRETGFFFLAGAHTSVHSLGHAVHHLLTWCEEHPEDRVRLLQDTALVQRFVHESFRLHPSSPVALRKALAQVIFEDGTTAGPGDRVVINLRLANRDVEIFGADADVFNPYRKPVRGVPETGITFGIGIHSCLGKNLAAGILPLPGQKIEADKRQLGMVTWMARGLLEAGAMRDPERPGRLDATIDRETWQTYPILLSADPGAGMLNSSEGT